MPHLSFLGCEPAWCGNWAARGLEFKRTVGVPHGVRKRRGLNSRDARVRFRRDAGLSCRWLRDPRAIRVGSANFAQSPRGFLSRESARGIVPIRATSPADRTTEHKTTTQATRNGRYQRRCSESVTRERQRMLATMTHSSRTLLQLGVYPPTGGVLRCPSAGSGPWAA